MGDCNHHWGMRSDKRFVCTHCGTFGNDEALLISISALERDNARLREELEAAKCPIVIHETELSSGEMWSSASQRARIDAALESEEG